MLASCNLSTVQDTDSTGVSDISTTDIGSQTEDSEVLEDSVDHVTPDSDDSEDIFEVYSFD